MKTKFLILLVSAVVIGQLVACKSGGSKLDSLWGEHENTPELDLIKAKEGIKRAIKLAESSAKCKEFKASEEIAVAMSAVTTDVEISELSTLVNESEALKKYLSTAIYMNVFDNDETLLSFNEEEMSRVLFDTKFIGTSRKNGKLIGALSFAVDGNLKFDRASDSKRTVGRWVVKGIAGSRKHITVNADFGKGEEEIQLDVALDSSKIGFNGNYLLKMKTAESSLSQMNFSNIDKSCL